jgi:hypothetical protein
MKANELRLGNWIADRGGKQWQIDHWETKDKVSAKSTTSTFNGFEFEGHPLTEYVEYLQPIPLTEEILLKCGFEKDEQWDNPFNKRVDVLNGFTIITIDVRANVLLLDDIEIKFQYLHQLQNLYFTLTNQELEINL